MDLLAPLALTAAGVLLVPSKALGPTLQTLLLAEFGLAAALLGVAVGGLAVIVAFLNDEYAAAISKTKSGAMGEFWPFWYTSTVVATAIIAAGAGVVAIAAEPGSQRAVFGVTTFLSVYSVTATVSLVAYVAQAGVNRARQLERDLVQRRQ